MTLQMTVCVPAPVGGHRPVEYALQVTDAVVIPAGTFVTGGECGLVEVFRAQ